MCPCEKPFGLETISRQKACKKRIDIVVDSVVATSVKRR
jgi:hypothetical protein